MPSSSTQPERRGTKRCASAISASVPPSPLLSARMRKMTYLTVTIRISAQVTRLTTPSTASSGETVARVWRRASRIA